MSFIKFSRQRVTRKDSLFPLLFLHLLLHSTMTLTFSFIISSSSSTFDDDIKWMVTVTGRLRWWYKAGIDGGHQVKGAVSLVSDGVFFWIAYDGDPIDSSSDTMAVIKPVKGSIMLPSHDSGWKLEHKKIKSLIRDGDSSQQSTYCWGYLLEEESNLVSQQARSPRHSLLLARLSRSTRAWLASCMLFSYVGVGVRFVGVSLLFQVFQLHLEHTSTTAARIIRDCSFPRLS